jgi:hypothetical protein
MASNVTTAKETNVIDAAALKRVREVDFVRQFTHRSLEKLTEVLGVTRRIPMMEGTTLYVYKIDGTLQDGAVGEGEIIPLSKYTQTKTAVGEITLNKWRKATTAEAIKKSGFNDAVRETDAQLLRDVQKSVRSTLFGFIDGSITGATTASGESFQAALANAWGQLQIKFEDDTVEPVYFVNPLDVAAYLGSANITTQTAFGMNYIEDFLGLGTVVISSQITQGTFVATAKQNFILYYLTMNGELANAFNLTTDETGFIGISSGNPTNERAQVETLVMDGITILVEYAEGVVKGVFDVNVKLDQHKATIAPEGTKALTASVYPSGSTVTWESSDTSVATVSSGTVTGVAAGTATITASVTVGGRTAKDTCEITVSAGA